MIRHAACGSNHRKSRIFNKRDKRLDNKQTRGWNYNNGIQNYFRPTGYLDKLNPKSLKNKSGVQILTIPVLRANIANITAAELSSGHITRTLPLFKVAWSYAGGADGGVYEFFVGLLYGGYNPAAATGGNSVPYKFKMCYYSE